MFDWIRILIALFLLVSSSQAMDRKGAAEVNRVRRACGMLALKNDARLARAAYHHAKYLGRLGAKGHTERPGRPYYFGKTPPERLARAGYPSRVGVENISYGDRNYRHSVRVLMSTLYHRLAFLDFRIDSIGSSEYGNRRGRIYVYDMAPSTVAELCRHPGKIEGEIYLYGVCADPKVRLSRRAFSAALGRIERRNARIVLYPPPGMQDAPAVYIRETPDPLAGIYGAGVPITAQFNPAYYRHVKLQRFRLSGPGGKMIPSKILSAGKDRYRKLPANTFVLVPLKRLQHGKEYRVSLIVTADGRVWKKSWSFRVK